MHRLHEVLESGEWGGFSDTVAEFEKTFAQRHKAKHCIASVNGTLTLEAALRVLDVGHGDEVIVPPYTFIATANAVRLVGATRDPATCGLDELAPYIRFGASPRASIYLALAARGHALVRRRDYVVPDDVKAMLHDVVRHRIAISYRAEAEGLNSDSLLDRIVERVPINDVGASHAAALD